MLYSQTPSTIADLTAPEVTAHINDQPYLSIKRIMVPVKDKRKLREGKLDFFFD